MAPLTRQIVLNSIKAFKEAESYDKERYIKGVQRNINEHKNALNELDWSYNVDEQIIQSGEKQIKT